MTYAEVVVNTPLYRRVTVTEELASEGGAADGSSPLSPTFHYAIPSELQNQATVGQLVWVPFGTRRRLQGLILALSDTSPVKKTKDLHEIIDPQPVLSPTQIELARWISNYYLAPLIDCVRLMLPPGIEQRAETVVELQADAPPQRNLTRQQRVVLKLLRRRSPQRLSQIGRQLKRCPELRPEPVKGLAEGMENARSVIGQLVRRGLVTTRSEISKPQVRPKRDRFVRLIADDAQIEQALPRLGRSSKQADVLLALAESGDPLLTLEEVRTAARCSESPIRALAEKGLVEITKGRQLVAPLLSPHAINEIIASDLSRAPRQAAALAYLRDRGGPVEVKEVYHQGGCSSAVLNKLEAKGYVERLSEESAVILAISLEEVTEAVIELRRAQKQVAVLEFLKGEEQPVWIGWVYAQTGCDLRTLRNLEKHGLVSLEEEEVKRDPLEGREFVTDVPPRLTPDQEAVWAEIARGMKEQERGDNVYLLHGVTGSGKTEIYLRALQMTLAMGQGAIVLVPEIALTPQTIRRFAARFPGHIAVLHGEVDVVIGPRSAVFAAMPHLGRIVMDGELE
jgi:primosomal protein N' (replication factor Y)